MREVSQGVLDGGGEVIGVIPQSIGSFKGNGAGGRGPTQRVDTVEKIAHQTQGDDG